MRWVRRILIVVALAGVTLLYLDAQHTFRFEAEAFTFESQGNTLAGTIHAPMGEGPHGVVVFVQGDGASTVSSGVFPVWEVLADAGYATVIWDKPGVGGSTGDWLDQDMGDRATEVVDALAALEVRDDLDLDVGNIGVMGASQGGWVVPLVAERVDVDFFIAWSTAVEWEAQGTYLTERQIANAGATEELAERVRSADRTDPGETYEQYVDWYDGLDGDVAAFFDKMPRDRWQFVVRNRDLDVRTTLDSLHGSPVLLLLGGQDDNVDVDETERVYREILSSPCLLVRRYANGDHDLIDHSGLVLTAIGTFQPRRIFAQGVLADIEEFVAGPHDC